MKRKNNPLKVIIDTNLWISFSLSKKLGNLDKIIKDKGILLLYSNDLLIEIKEIFSRTKFAKTLPKETLEEILSLLKDSGREIIVTSEVDICRDKKDNFLLSLCKDGYANFLITGDKDLLEIKKIDSTKILTYSEFLKI